MTYIYFHAANGNLVRAPVPVTDVMMARNQGRFIAAFVYRANVRRVFAVVPRGV